MNRLHRSLGLAALACSFAALACSSVALPPAAEAAAWSLPRWGSLFVATEVLHLKTGPRSGGRITATFDDNTTTGTDLSLLGGDGMEGLEYVPRATAGLRSPEYKGWSGGIQARHFALANSLSGPPTLAPGTTPLPNFTTETETSHLELDATDVELFAAFAWQGLAVEGTYGRRTADFTTNASTEVFGVFTTGNFVNLRLSNGSAFEGQGPVVGWTFSYKVPRVPVSFFYGERNGDIEGESDSFGRVVGTVASSPSAPLVGAATVTRNNNSHTDLEFDEMRYGVQADFGAADARVRSFARLAYERLDWTLKGPPTGGAGFGGTIGNLTTNSFSSAGLGGVTTKGWAFSLGVVF